MPRHAPSGALRAPARLSALRLSALRLSMAGLALLAAACTVRPEPFDEAALQQRVDSDMQQISQREFVPDGPVSLHEAMARAVAYNLQHRVKQLEIDIATAEVQQASYDMLPELDTELGWSADSVRVSPFSDRIAFTGSAGIAWNLLDLGVSYARAKQSADQVLVATEKRRKAVQDILREVRVLYAEAAGADALLEQARVLSTEVQAAIATSRDLEALRVQSRPDAIGYRRALAEQLQQIVTRRADLQAAKSRLAELLNIPPGTEFQLVAEAGSRYVPTVPMSLRELEQHALLSRPELNVEDYNARIGEWQVREAMFNMLPGLDLEWTRNYSSDRTYLTDSWSNNSYLLGMNLFKLFSAPAEIEAAEGRAEIARAQRLALSVAVMTQVNIAYRRLNDASHRYQLMGRIREADSSLLQLANEEQVLTGGNRLKAIEAAMRQLRTGFEQQEAYGELVQAHSDLMHAIGLDVLPQDADGMDLPALKASIKSSLEQWEQVTPNREEKPRSLEALLDRMFAPVATALAAALPGGRDKAGDQTESQLAAFDDYGFLADVGVSRVAAATDPVEDYGWLGSAPPAGLSVWTAAQAEPAPEAAGDPAAGSEAAIAFDLLEAIAPAARGPAAGDETLATGAEPMARPAEDTPAETAPAPAAAAPAAAAVQHYVQVGAFRQHDLAQALLARVQVRHAGLTDGHALTVQAGTGKDGKPLYRVRLGGFEDRAAARSLCSSLKAQKQDCFAVSEPGTLRTADCAASAQPAQMAR